MLAAVLYGKEDVRVERQPVPPVGPGEVRIRIAAALTCGTDVKVYRRGYHAHMLRPPVRFGHELAGTIDAVGAGVTRWRAGQRVVAANSAPCGGCFYCGRNRPELCEELLFMNGAYAEYITVPARIVEKNLLEIPDSLPIEQAAMTEPLACVVYGLQDAPVSQGETVIVLGLGPIGLMFVRLCCLAGARVLAAGRRQDRLELAAHLGAAEVFDERAVPNLADELKSCTEGGRGADMVIECVGRPEAWELAISLARKAGRVSLFGGCPADSSIQLSTHRIHYDEITLKGTFHHTPQTVRRALELIATGQVPAGEFIQRRAPLTDLPVLLAELAAGGGAVKTAVIPGHAGG
jgi:L-iditol 2-dehydrogenase